MGDKLYHVEATISFDLCVMLPEGLTDYQIKSWLIDYAKEEYEMRFEPDIQLHYREVENEDYSGPFDWSENDLIYTNEVNDVTLKEAKERCIKANQEDSMEGKCE